MLESLRRCTTAIHFSTCTNPGNVQNRKSISMPAETFTCLYYGGIRPMGDCQASFYLIFRFKYRGPPTPFHLPAGSVIWEEGRLAQHADPLHEASAPEKNRTFLRSSQPPRSSQPWPPTAEVICSRNFPGSCCPPSTPNLKTPPPNLPPTTAIALISAPLKPHFFREECGA